MDYGKLLTRAWHIVWTNKWLFVLGFLAALGSGGSGGGGGSNFRTQAPEEFGPQFSGEFSNIMSQIAPYIVVLVGFFFVLAIILWLLRLIGEAGMIASVDRIESGEKLTLRDGFQAGMSHLKNMVGLSLVLYAPFILVGLVFAGGAISLALGGVDGGEELLARGFGLIGLCLIPLACILTIVGLVLAFVYPMAQRGIILEGFGVMDGIRRGWQVLRENLADILLLAILFAFINLIVGIATLIIALPIALIFIIPTVIAAVQGGTAFTVGAIMMGIAGIIVFILLAAAISSILRAFQSTSFTLAYQQWVGKSMKAKAAT